MTLFTGLGWLLIIVGIAGLMFPSGDQSTAGLILMGAILIGFGSISKRLASDTYAINITTPSEKKSKPTQMSIRY
jgi:hypothetical protein